MDIVYNLPFELKINNTLVTTFTENELQIYATEFSSIQIYENNDVDIYFNSDDNEAKLYLEALNIVPDGYGVIYDEEGRPYRGVSNIAMPLFKNNGQYDALRVDSFRMVVIAHGKTFYSFLDVIPKQLSDKEWCVMRDDLEKEITGLTQDVVRRNISLGNCKAGALPPEKLYAFIVIRKYS